MKKAFRIIGIVLALSLIMGLAISCDANTAPDGKTPETKKSMTSAEYKANSKALESVMVVEAYAIANPEEAVSGTKSIAGEYKVVFNGQKTIKTSEIMSQLEDKAAASASEGEKAFYSTLAASLPPNVELEVKAGSYVEYRVDENGVSHISSLDIEIVLDGKTIEIEKDEDDKWIEIDGTFFDNSELEMMLDAADDAADAIEEFFEELGKGIEFDLSTLISNKETNISFEIKDDDETIKGTALLKVDSNKLLMSFNVKYVEYDEKAIEKELTIEASIAFNLDPSFIKNISALDIEKLVENIAADSVSVKVNGMDVWTEAFIDELD